MEFKVRKVGGVMAEVTVSEGSATIDLGILSALEVTRLASDLRQFAHDLDQIEMVTKESALDAIEFLQDNAEVAAYLIQDARDILEEAP